MIHTQQSTRISNTLQDWHRKSTQVPKGLVCINHQLPEYIFVDEPTAHFASSFKAQFNLSIFSFGLINPPLNLTLFGMTTKGEQKMNIRRITSLTALASFLFVTIIVLYIVPQGRVAYWADWHLWGLTKTDWGNLHKK